ncbi:MAG: hypothetical protein Q7O66_01605 [Dehalococcoidia bacterium]|nr:hypothetical protein [Dehalococcoidia bacterium]
MAKNKPGITGDELLAEYIEQYDPAKRPVHCSNCGHARVSVATVNPDVRCHREHGKPMKLWSIIRPTSPRCFDVAARCEHFESMDSAKN